MDGWMQQKMSLASAPVEGGRGRGSAAQRGAEGTRVLAIVVSRNVAIHPGGFGRASTGSAASRLETCCSSFLASLMWMGWWAVGAHCVFPVDVPACWAWTRIAQALANPRFHRPSCTVPRTVLAHACQPRRQPAPSLSIPILDHHSHENCLFQYYPQVKLYKHNRIIKYGLFGCALNATWDDGPLRDRGRPGIQPASRASCHMSVRKETSRLPRFPPSFSPVLRLSPSVRCLSLRACSRVGSWVRLRVRSFAQFVVDWHAPNALDFPQQSLSAMLFFPLYYMASSHRSVRGGLVASCPKR